MTAKHAFGDIDALFDRFAATGVAPGLAFGVVADGELAHAGGRGTLRAGEIAEPGPDSVFRIASMTKSFTASTVLLLRDDGRLRLDDPVTRLVPELAGLPAWSRDAAPMTVESLLTMSAGFPTDDPWGDRLQDQDPAAFLSFLASGPELAWPVGTHFEYANLGFAILGVVISRAADEAYRAVVERRILRPLGLGSTAYDDEGIDPARLARGYVRRDDAWVEEPTAAYGAFAPMGGLFASVRDLARWVGGFTDAFPARDDPDDGHPLSRATRREMQQLRRPILPELTWRSAAGVPSAGVAGYGYGLFVTLDVTLGRIVGHGGGYPGFGSHMRWHPASGIGVVGLANGRYAPVVDATSEALALLVGRDLAPIRRPRPWVATTAARASVERLFEAWDDELAGTLFAPNVALDEPPPARRAELERIRSVHGRLRADDDAAPESRSVAHLAWWLAGERGRVRVEILMSPDRPARIQSLIVTSVPAPPPALAVVARRIVELLALPGPSWPEELRLAGTVDRPALDRELRAAEALFGPVVLGPPTGGDGKTDATWLLSGERGNLTLTVAIEADGGRVSKVGLVPVTLESPIHLA